MRDILKSVLLAGGGYGLAKATEGKKQETKISAAIERCPFCGDIFDVDERFCNNCGKPRKKEKRLTQRCSSCKKVLHQGEKFCTECGNPVYGE